MTYRSNIIGFWDNPIRDQIAYHKFSGPAARKSLKSPEYAAHCGPCRSATCRERSATGPGQKLGKPQSFIAKYEGGERHGGVVELLRLPAPDADPVKLFRDFVAGKPASSPRRTAG
jgi:hypothetical protein